MEKQFEVIFKQHHSRVLRVAYYIVKNRDAAEDIAQEVFFKLWDKRSEISDIESIEGYLVRMARNHALNYIQSSGKEDVDTELVLKRDRVELADPQTDTDAFREVLQKAVSQLSPQCRLVFSLSRFEGLDNEEIAEYLEISKRTVETQISTAFRRFRTDLKHIFITLMSSTIPALLTFNNWF
ncbi:MAG: RNA polymerase sigma-70 factor [Cyclobacteriaceae bacterium]